MTDQTPAPSYFPSFEALVLADLAILKAAIPPLTAKSDEHDKEIQAIRLERATRSLSCPLVLMLEKKVNRRFTVLERGVLLIKGGYAAVAGIAGAVFLILTALYHILGISRLLASSKP